VYAGYDQVWRYDLDAGWTRISNFTGSAEVPAREIALTPYNPQAVAVLKSGGNATSRQIWLTKDDGATWKKINVGFIALGLSFPTDLCFGNTDDELYVTFGGFSAARKVYRTLDGGDNWEKLTKDLPNIPVIAVAHHYGTPEHRVYIGTDFGMYYTDDSLDHWVPMQEGLPNMRVADLDLHYASGKIYAGTYGRGIWSNDLAPVSGAPEAPIHRARMTVAPNPNAGAFTLHLSDLEPGAYRLAVIDVLGRRHLEQTLQIDRPSLELPLQSALPSGMYYLQLGRGRHSKTASFFVKS
jgi:hypothetical protein